MRGLARGARSPVAPAGDATSNEPMVPDTGEPRIVQQVRGQFASWAAVSLGCFGINVATGLDTPWFLFPTFGMGIGLLSNYARLWQSGYSWRDVLTRPAGARRGGDDDGQGREAAARGCRSPRPRSSAPISPRSCRCRATGSRSAS